MFEDLRHTLGYVSSLYRFRKRHDRVIRFTNALSSSRSVMVVLPLRVENDYQQYRAVIDLLKRTFKGERIIIVSGDHAVDAMRSLPRSTFIHFRPDELDFRFLPRRGLSERIRSCSPDLAIDLNLDFLLPSGYICMVSGARVRVGFLRKHSGLCFNFQVRPDRTLGRTAVYNRLAEFLERL